MPAAGIEGWRPWGAGGPNLYHTVVPNATAVAEDLIGQVAFRALALRGSFAAGDVVRPTLAGGDGASLVEDLQLTHEGRGMAWTADVEDSNASCILQALLLCNTHESPLPKSKYHERVKRYQEREYTKEHETWILEPQNLGSIRTELVFMQTE